MNEQKINTIIIGCDKGVLDPASDVRARMIDYGPLVKELHLHVPVAMWQYPTPQVQIASNVWIIGVVHTNKVIRWAKSLVQLFSYTRKHKIDVITAPDPFMKGWVALTLSWFTGAKILLSVYGSNIFSPEWYSQNLLTRIYSFVGRIVFSGANAIQTDGRETLHQLQSMFGAKVFYKPLIPKNIGMFLNISRDATKNNPVRILFVARLITQKNIPMLVAVIKKIVASQHNTGVTFTIIGEGPHTPFLQHELAVEIKNGTVVHHTYYSREDIVSLYSTHDILILTSLFEGFPRVFMEAAASAMPIVSTRVSGLEGLVADNQSGFIVEQNDTPAFVEKLNELIADPEKRRAFGVRGREQFVASFSYEGMLALQKNIFEYLAKQ